MNFIRVTAEQCNPQGHTISGTVRTEMQLNIDLVGAIRGNEILLKGDEVIFLGGQYFKHFNLAVGVHVPG